VDLTTGRRVLLHPRVLVSLVVLVVLAVPLGVLAHGRQGDGGPRAQLIADAPGPTTLTRITSTADFARGVARGTRAASGSVTLSRPLGSRTVAGVRYEHARWTSPWVAPGHGFTELVPSWSARTPGGSWIQVHVRARDSRGRVSGFKDLGRWSSRDRVFRRTSAGSQSDALVRVATDTLKAQPGVRLAAYKVRVRLMRRPGKAGPTLRSISAAASLLPAVVPATSRPLSSAAVSLAVPGYSQMIHRGQNPEYGNGGEAWCSPTSLAMVLGYYGRLPAARSYAWVNTSYADRWVNHLARLTYDYRYRGTGNWSFNTAVGANRVSDAFVTRLRDLRMAERFVRAGIPLAVSIRFGRGQLTGAPISSTAGHLAVLSGFTAAGDPIVMDPAAPRNSTVRRTYDRAQFERAWISGSGGMAYVLRDRAHPLPTRPAGVRAW
jgi:hypothetical protein